MKPHEFATAATVTGVSRVTFRVARSRSGLFGSMVSLVVREYHQVHAVREVSFRIERGEMVGCVGPNGAGKSTTIKMLTGILVPSGGKVTVLGQFRLSFMPVNVA